MKARKVLAILSAVLLAFVGIAWLWLRSVELSKRLHLEKRVEQIQETLNARSGQRPVLRDTPIPGNAWDDYFQGADVIAKIGDSTPIRKYAFRFKDGDPVKARAALEPYLAAVEWMREGTRRTEARRVRFQEEAFYDGGSDARLGRLAKMSSLVVCQARLLTDENKLREAWALLLDLCRFAHDVAGDGSVMAMLVGLSTYDRALDEMKELLEKRRFSSELCSQLDRELGTLDAVFPRRGPAILGQLEMAGELIVKDQLIDVMLRGKTLPQEFRPGWRQAFSWPLMLVAAFDEADALFLPVCTAEERSCKEEDAWWHRVQPELSASKNPFVRTLIAMSYVGSRPLRETRTRLRLLRTVAHYGATGEILRLDDPFGSKLLHDEENGSLILWGVGSNGKDDRGKGKWVDGHDDLWIEIPLRP